MESEEAKVEKEEKQTLAKDETEASVCEIEESQKSEADKGQSPELKPVMTESSEKTSSGRKAKLQAAAAAAAASKMKKLEGETSLLTDVSRKKKKSPVTHPRTTDMVVEAIRELKDSKGSSVQSIRAWILANYKTVRPDMIKVMLKKGLQQGLDEGLLVRPKKQTSTQVLSGRYRVGKSLGGGAAASSTSLTKDRKSIAETSTPKPKAKLKPKPKKKAKVIKATPIKETKAPVAKVKISKSPKKSKQKTTTKAKRQIVIETVSATPKSKKSKLKSKTPVEKISKPVLKSLRVKAEPLLVKAVTPIVKSQSTGKGKKAKNGSKSSDNLSPSRVAPTKRTRDKLSSKTVKKTPVKGKEIKSESSPRLKRYSKKKK